MDGTNTNYPENEDKRKRNQSEEGSDSSGMTGMDAERFDNEVAEDDIE